VKDATGYVHTSEKMIISSSKKSKRTTNPIRNIVDNLKPPKDHPKPFLNLALGDPTAHGNMTCPSVLVEAVQKVLETNSANGYIPSVGAPKAREAIAKYSSSPGYEVSTEDVIIASGCSGAIDLLLSALLDEGDNILVPKPGFALYQVVADSIGASVKHYPLLPDDSWACDLDAMDALIDERTKGILINNPSNPCGSNFTVEHVKAIAAVARKHGLPIIADEIYAGCVFTGTFSPAHICSGDVPVISLGGLAKEFVVPGWRIGWLVVHDKGTGRLKELAQGIRSLSQIILGGCSLIQGAIPQLLCPAPNSAEQRSLQIFSDCCKNILRENVTLCMRLLADNRVLDVIEPQGAMYALLRINTQYLTSGEIPNDEEFARLLLLEQNVFILPGKCFSVDNFVRLVICCPNEKVIDACERLNEFCHKHCCISEKYLPGSSALSHTTGTAAAAAAAEEEEEEEDVRLQVVIKKPFESTTTTTTTTTSTKRPATATTATATVIEPSMVDGPAGSELQHSMHKSKLAKIV